MMILLPPALIAHLPQVEQRRSLPWTFELEGQIVNLGRNNVNVPGNGGTLFDIRRVTGSDTFVGARATLTYERPEGGPGFRFLYAPLRRTGTGTLSGPTLFDGTTFDPGVATQGVYKFDNYRLTYRNRIKKTERSDWRIGLTAIIVDAEYSLRQGAVSESFTSVGVVPLIHLYLEERLGDRFLFNLDFDGWGVSQGRAFDTGLRLMYEANDRTRFFAGYRFLDGGVNVESDYNSLFASYFLAGVQVRF